MRTATALLGVLWISATVPAAGADYWPMTDGATFHYATEAGATLDVTLRAGLSGSVISRHTVASGTTCSSGNDFFVDGDGDVALGGGSAYCEDFVDPGFWVFTPPVKFLDLPLTVGKSWTSDAVPGALWHFDVIGEQEVTVPAGTFHTYALSVFVIGVDGLPVGTYYLDRDLGPVILPGGYRLVSWTGVVGTGGASWGALKSLYR